MTTDIQQGKKSEATEASAGPASPVRRATGRHQRHSAALCGVPIRDEWRWAMTTPPENANARRQPGERVKLTNYAPSVAPVRPGIKLIPSADRNREISAREGRAARLRRKRNGETFGTPELSTWPVGGGVCRFQTRHPDIAKKLSQRRGARLVAYSVHGGYLRVFEERIEPWRARNLVRRFLRATNGAFFDLKRPPARRKSQGATKVQGGVA